MHDESLYAERALRAGASGYITKHESADNVLLAIRRVLAGEVYLSGTLTSAFLKGLTGGLKGTSQPLDRLTDRELEIPNDNDAPTREGLADPRCTFPRLLYRFASDDAYHRCRGGRQ